MLILIFLSSGLFLGWSLGANDAANVFGTAVGTKMIKFRTAAIISGVCIIIGAVVSGAGTTGTLGRLGSVNEIGGAFIAALSAGLTVYWMTKLNLPVSTSQSIVGAIIAWNIFSGSRTDYDSLVKITATWITSPVLAAVFSIVIYRAGKLVSSKMRIHLLKMDMYNRTGLLLIGAFGSYSLGANNIANVIGVFVPAYPFRPLKFQFVTFTGTELLLLLGGISIAVGVFTYSYKVMETIGRRIFKLTPEMALAVVLASSLVLFLFASEEFEFFLASMGLPTIPLVPVSSSQAIIGAIVGIGLLKSRNSLDYRMLGKIASGWVSTPIMAGLLCYVSLFIFQNVFSQRVYKRVTYIVNHEVMEILRTENINLPAETAAEIIDRQFDFEMELFNTLEKYRVPDAAADKILFYSRIERIRVDTTAVIKDGQRGLFSKCQWDALKALDGKKFIYFWQFQKGLGSACGDWALMPDNIMNRFHNRKIRSKLNYCRSKFLVYE